MSPYVWVWLRLHLGQYLEGALGPLGPLVFIRASLFVLTLPKRGGLLAKLDTLSYLPLLIEQKGKGVSDAFRYTDSGKSRGRGVDVEQERGPT